ncbi:MAG: GAF domain-containing protein [Flavobacteriaceae bacterium]
MKSTLPITPFKPILSFDKLISQIEQKSVDEGVEIFERNYLKEILKIVEPLKGNEQVFQTFDDLKPFEKQLKALLQFLFPESMTENEIKAISYPFDSTVFSPTNRFQKILNNAGRDFTLEIKNFNSEFLFQLQCSFILKKVYNVKLDFSGPFFIDIPEASGSIRNYKVTYNVDFIDIEATSKAKELTQDDIDQLLSDSSNVEFWREVFPPESYILRGFSVINLVDVTLDDAISSIKTALLTEDDFIKLRHVFVDIFRTLFTVNDIEIGFTRFDSENQTLSEFDFLDLPNFTLDGNTHKHCKKGLCPSSYRSLIEEKTFYVISSVENYFERSGGNFLSTSLKHRNFGSCILAPILNGDQLLGVLEIVSHQKNALNDVNVYKLEGVIPYIAATLGKKIRSYEDRLKAVIQSECTSIHPSVFWAFEDEAKRFIKKKQKKDLAIFKDITFNDVFPLYGQIDMIGSSDLRNEAIQNDLLYILNLAQEIISKADQENDVKLFEEKCFELKQLIELVKSGLNSDTEQNSIKLLRNHITPLVDHIETQYLSVNELVKSYKEFAENDFKSNQRHREKYDQDVAAFNEELSTLIDQSQEQAQSIFPHYFERYKTDGVDHSMYVGSAISQNKAFHNIHLQNLRLWQLKTMCEMERKFYEVKEQLKSKLNAASLILIYNTPISIRYRMDEKKFDIDGSYNARYEIIKKRIDKAHIKNTDERITQKGKIVIVYSGEEEEKEYKKYIHFLQSIDYVDKKIECFDVEDLQGVSGLKALRVKIVFNSPNRILKVQAPSTIAN